MSTTDQVTAVDKVVLESYLKKLYLTTFIRQHEAYAAEAAQSNQSYSRFLLALAEQEVLEREARRRQRRLKEAKIPVVKDLTSFDFNVIPQLNQQKIRHLLTGEYIEKVEPVILIGNPGLGKTHIATALAVAATQQMLRVRFYNAAALVNDLLQAQDDGRIDAFIRKALNFRLIVIDELGSHYRTREEAKTDIFFYIESFYNCRRRQSSLGYLSPFAYEAAYHEQAAALGHCLRPLN